jgi:hypothetical protein
LEPCHQIEDTLDRSIFHSLLIIQIPFDDQLAVSIDMHVPRQVISLPSKEDKPALPCRSGKSGNVCQTGGAKGTIPRFYAGEYWSMASATTLVSEPAAKNEPTRRRD